MSDDAEREAKARYVAALTKLARSLVDQGLLIEAGWITVRSMILPRDAPAGAVDMGRAMFFAGAQHLFGSLVGQGGVLDPDGDPTDDDMRRMERIHSELQAFIDDFAKRHGVKLPFRDEAPVVRQ